MKKLKFVAATLAVLAAGAAVGGYIYKKINEQKEDEETENEETTYIVQSSLPEDEQ